MAASPDLEAGGLPASPRPAANGGSAAALPQSSPAAPSPPPSAAAATDDEPRLGWWARLNRAVKKLKREVLALHYAIQVGAQPKGVRHRSCALWRCRGSSLQVALVTHGNRIGLSFSPLLHLILLGVQCRDTHTVFVCTYIHPNCTAHGHRLPLACCSACCLLPSACCLHCRTLAWACCPACSPSWPLPTP